jgi:DNA-binding XRE family transcriptional regulator
MHLDSYIKRRGRGAHAALAKACDVSWSTINDIRKNGAIPKLPLALTIERETGGAVTIADLCGAKKGRKR